MMMTDRLAARILAKYLAEEQAATPISLAFAAQLNLIHDPSRLKAALCTRRAGKSLTAAIYLLHEALSRPDTPCAYIALTRDSARRIMWRPGLKWVARQCGVYDEIEWNESTLTANFKNGSSIFLVGMDSTDTEREKLLGQKYKLVVIDEAGSFRIDLEDAVYSTLKPATADLGGTILMIGTPTNYMTGLYYRVTTGEESGWSTHRWSAFDNPHMAKQWQDEIDDLKERKPGVETTPIFRQQYLGEWAMDSDALVLHIDPVDPFDTSSYIHGIGIDLGWQDATALTVVCWRRHQRTLYVVHSEKHQHLDITDTAKRIRELEQRYSPQFMVIDAANRQAYEEIVRRHQLPLIPATKQGKAEHLCMLDSDIRTGLVKVFSSCGALIEEAKFLVWDDKATKLKERDGLDNHSVDSFLYAWRHARNYVETKAPVAIDRREESAILEALEKEAERHERMKRLAEREEGLLYGETDY